MSYYATQTELSFNYPPAATARSAGGFNKDNSEVIGRWVQATTGGAVLLVANNVKPLGVITRLSATKVAVAVGPIVKGKQAGTTAIAAGSAITGSERAVASGDDQRGFIKAETGNDAPSAIRRVGAVLDSGTSTANTEGTANTQVLMFA